MSEQRIPAGGTPPQVSAGSQGVATVSDAVGEDWAVLPETVRRRAAKAAVTKMVPHPSLEERQRRGRVARAEVPRERLPGWEAAADRPDPVALLVGQEASRVQELVPVRHVRMAAFAFYRGAALLMAAGSSIPRRASVIGEPCLEAT